MAEEVQPKVCPVCGHAGEDAFDVLEAVVHIQTYLYPQGLPVNEDSPAQARGLRFTRRLRCRKCGYLVFFDTSAH